MPKTKSHLIISIPIILFILFLPVMGTQDTSDTKCPDTNNPNAGIVVAKISIDASNIFTNWDTCPWIIGSGSQEDPYILENLVIDAGGVGSAILIKNSDVDFIIRNCILSNSGAEYGDAGISLDNIMNGYIVNNTIKDCENGISAFDDSANISIENNTLLSNYMGIHLIGSNVLVKNNSMDMNNYGIWVQIGGKNNITKNSIFNSVNSGIFIGSMEFPNLITENILHNNWNGINLFSGTTLQNVSENDCQFNYRGISISGSSNNFVSRNLCSDNNYGIFMEDSSSNNISSNICYENDYGIYVTAAALNYIDSNIVFNCITPLFDDDSNNFWIDNILSKPNPNTPSIAPVPTKHYSEVVLEWTKGLFTDNYYLFRYTRLITAINGSVDLIYTGSNSTFVDVNPGVDETFYYCVVAENDQGNSTLSINVNTYVNCFLPRPVNLSYSYTPSNPGMINLAWNSVDGMADNYTIYRSSKFFIEIEENVECIANTSNLFYLDFSDTETILYYCILSNNETGSSILSNCEAIFVDFPGPKPPILNEVFSPQLSYTSNIAWIESLDATNYTLYRSRQFITEINSSCVELGTTDNFHLEDSYEEEGFYYYVLIARNETGESSLSNCIDIYIEFPPLDSPLITAEKMFITDGLVKLLWDAVERANMYLIFRSQTEFSEINENVEFVGNTTKCTFIDGLTNNGNYHYGVIAENEWVNSSLSNIKEIEFHIKSHPTILIDGDSVTLGWDQNPFVSGSGTQDDPYILENLIIDAGGVGSAILIRNSDVFFVIRNCILSNSGDEFWDSGIFLIRAQNGSILNNNVGDCSGGIVASENCANTVIENNTVLSNYMGIKIYGSKILVKNNSLDMNYFGIWIQIEGNNNITKNSISNSNSSGIIIASMEFPNMITENILRNNRDGIHLFSGTTLQNVSENDCQYNYYGIKVTESNFNNITNNICSNNNYGIYLDEESTGNYISNNRIFSCNIPIFDETNGNFWINNYDTLLLPESPILSSISSISYNGSIDLKWSGCAYSDRYKIYWYTSPITEINSSVSLIYSGQDLSFSFRLTIQGSYYFIIQAENALGTALSNITGTYVSFTLPHPPRLNPLVEFSSDGLINLNWSVIENAEYYSIYRSPTPFDIIIEKKYLIGESKFPWYIDSIGINPERILFNYAIVAVNGTGSSSCSNFESVLVDFPDPLSTELTIENPLELSGSISFTWMRTPEAEYYTIYRSESSITEINNTCGILSTTSFNSFTDHLRADGVYYYALTVHNASGISLISNCIEIRADFAEPSAPELFKPIYSENTPIIVLEGSIVSGAENYLFYWSYYPITSINESVFLLEMNDIPYYGGIMNTTGVFYFVLVASNVNGTSSPSNCVQLEIIEVKDNPFGSPDDILDSMGIPGYPLFISVFIFSIATVGFLQNKKLKHIRDDLSKKNTGHS